MLYTDKAIIVEGKYDKIKLSSVIDAVIIPTDGFDIFKNAEKQRLISFYAEKSGIIILTDSDSAGFKIRSMIKGFVPEDRITNAYIPDIYGKERRKEKPSKEGKLGVEGVSAEIICEALKRAGADESRRQAGKFSVCDLYELGLYGRADSAKKRRAVLRTLSLPEKLSAKGFVQAVNAGITEEELKAAIESTSKK